LLSHQHASLVAVLAQPPQELHARELTCCLCSAEKSRGSFVAPDRTSQDCEGFERFGQRTEITGRPSELQTLARQADCSSDVSSHQRDLSERE
jgi:hypothetical protein